MQTKSGILKPVFYIGVAVVVLLVVGIQSYRYLMSPPRYSNQYVIVKVSPGDTPQVIAKQLRQDGLIRDERAFRWKIWLDKQASSLQAGTYRFQQGTSVDEIIQRMAAGEVYRDLVRFTVPEGLTLEQIADTLAKSGLANRELFLKEADHGTFEGVIVQSLPSGVPLKHRLEGYLFPDTYEVEKGTTEHDLIQRMLSQMEQAVTPQIRDEWKKEGLTVHQGLTLASLVEREARVPVERPRIAGVMFNRLQANPPMMLQIDATIQYILGQKPELSLQDLEVKSPYNTYLHEGLPPGPIASPGLASIEAVAKPEKNDYLFYVTKKDGSGEHYFAKTLAEHNRNIALSEANQANQKKSER